MADFKTHITVSTLFGIGYGSGAYFGYHLPVESCLLAGGLCSVSGMLPDVDSDSGVPLRESLSFAAAMVSMMFIHRLHQMGISPEMTVLAGAAAYLAVRFGFGEGIRRCTVHRGMFHSLPAALIAAELAFLLGTGSEPVRYFKAGGVLLGYVSHLALDELFSFQMKRGRLRLKQSFGTALKLVGQEWLPNIATYGLLIALTWTSLKEPGWTQSHFSQPGAGTEITQQRGVLPLQLPTAKDSRQTDTPWYR